MNAGMIEEKQGYFHVTEEGKKEFALHSTASISNTIMIFLGVAILFLLFRLSMDSCSKRKCGVFRDSAHYHWLSIFGGRPKKQAKTAG